MKRICLLIFLFLLVRPAISQYTIRVQVDSIPTTRAFLFEFVGVKPQMVDSARVGVGGKFSFSLGPQAHPGMYRIVVGPNNFWDIIFNREEVEMRTHFAAPLDSLKILRSQENLLLKQYMTHYITLNRKTEAIKQLLTLYLPNDPFFKNLTTERTRLLSENPDDIARGIIASHPEKYVARFLKTELAPRVPTGVSKEGELRYMLEHFFDEVDFTDTVLMYSPPLIGKIRTYFNLIPQAYPSGKVEEEMIRGLDRIMSLAAVNDVLFGFILEDIAEWSERTDFDQFFAYLTEYYLSEAACKDDKRAEEIEELLKAIKKTEVGKIAPEIVMPTDDRGVILLSEIKAKYRLVLFWASWCPHCVEILPELKKLYLNHSRDQFDIVAISIDEKRQEWQNAIKKGEYPWINYSELKGWDCSISYDYGIRATPTMILIDRAGKIIAKPRNVQLLGVKLRELGL